MSKRHGLGRRDGPGPFWGATYSRTWFSTLAGIPLLAGAYFSILGGTDSWPILLALTVVIVGIIWAVPLSVVSASGIRMVLRQKVVPWSDVAAVLDPRPGDQEARIELVGGDTMAVPGVAPRLVAVLRELHRAGR